VALISPTTLALQPLQLRHLKKLRFGYASFTFTHAEVDTAQTVYVRLKCGLNQGAYKMSYYVTLQGADTKTVTVMAV
jgi:hypothetical protein